VTGLSLSHGAVTSGSHFRHDHVAQAFSWDWSVLERWPAEWVRAAIGHELLHGYRNLCAIRLSEDEEGLDRGLDSWGVPGTIAREAAADDGDEDPR
jgi:hypothetical protein